MKTSLTIICIILLNSFSFGQKEELEMLLKYKPASNLNLFALDTKLLNFSNSISIPNDSQLLMLFEQDSTETVYYISDWDSDNMKNLNIKKYYTYRLISINEVNNIIFICYYKMGNLSKKIYLSIYADFELKNKLLIGFEKGDNEVLEYMEALIVENYQLTTYNYKFNPEFNSENYLEGQNIPMSLVTISKYNIDLKNGKFELFEQELKYSKCPPESFTNQNPDCPLFSF